MTIEIVQIGSYQHALHYTTREGVEIYTRKGNKGENDFIVKYREPGNTLFGRRKSLRTPKHIHMVVDLFMKRTGNRQLTENFLDHIVTNVCKKVTPATTNLPALTLFNPKYLSDYDGLNKYGEYSVEFLLVTLELIQTQEITNYPEGTGHYGLYESLRNGDSIFSVVSGATLNWGH